jgi:hypothetical protein
VRRPRLEVADVFHRHGAAWRKANAGHVSLGQLKVMSAIESCRSAALGGHVERCEDCGHSRIAYNSCLMGKFRNGELVHDRLGSDTPFGRSRSPLRISPEHGDQFVRGPEGPLAQVWWNDGLDGFELFTGIATRTDTRAKVPAIGGDREQRFGRRAEQPLP